MSNLKDKRTKEQILKLLDNAIEQEERLSEKIKLLETELAGCHKKAKDPRHELTEEALSASKVSFRIDYYRTDKSGPLKGIIEHIPSREPKPFEGEGWDVMQNFIGCYLSEESVSVGKKKTASKKEAIEEAADLSQPFSVEQSVLLPAEEEGVNLLQRLRSKMATQTQAILPEKAVLSLEQQGGSRLLQRLKAEFAATQTQAANNPPVQMQAAKPAVAPPPPPQRSAGNQYLTQRTVAVPTTQQKKPMAQQPVPSRENKITEQGSESRSRLLERLREEQRQGFKPQ
jgi:hypothetical protein